MDVKTIKEALLKGERVTLECKRAKAEVELVLPVSAPKTVNETKDATIQKDLVSQVVPSMSQVQFTKSAIVLLDLVGKSSLPISALMEKVGEANRSRFRNNILNPLIEAQLVEPTQKDTPQSPKQKYALTAKGKELLKDVIDKK